MNATGMTALLDRPMPGALPMLRFHGDDGAGSDRLQAWRERLKHLCEIGPRDATALPPRPYQMAMTAWHLGGLVMTEVAYGSGVQSRTARHIRGDGLDHYRVTLITEGSCRVGSDTPRTVHAGQILVADMARPGLAVHSAGGCVSVFVPRESLDELLLKPVDLHGQVLSGVVSDVLAAHLRGLPRALPLLCTEHAHSLVAPTLHLLAAAIGSEPALRCPTGGEVTLLRRASRFIEMHLQDEDLSPQAVAQALSVSRATLYRLFEPLGGVSAFIKERRLVLIHEALREPGRRPSLATLAEDHGFKSAGHFSDAFLRHFGYRPSEVRPRSGGGETTAVQAAASVPPTAPAVFGARTGDPDSLLRWLRVLR